VISPELLSVETLPSRGRLPSISGQDNHPDSNQANRRPRHEGDNHSTA
jgi:hypothetical protein